MSLMKGLVNKFINTLRKKSFEDASILLISRLIEEQYGKDIDIQKTLLPVFYASSQGITITMAVRKLRKKERQVHSNKYILNTLADFPETVIDEINHKTRDVIMQVAKRFGFCNRRTIVSIDFHDKPFYGKKNIGQIVGTKRKAGTNHAYQYATICICEEGKRFNLATIPRTQLLTKKTVVNFLLAIAKQYVHIGVVLLDRGFNATDLYDFLDAKNYYYIMPLIRHDKVKRVCASTKKLTVMPYTFYEDRPIEYQTTVRVIVDNREKDRHYFVTNIQGDRRAVLSIIVSSYRKRWGIETGYRVASEFYAWTTSTRFPIRCMLGLFSFLMQDLWTLYNFIEQSETPTQQPRKRLLRGCRKIILFLKKSVQELSLVWKPEIEAEIFREDLTTNLLSRM